MRPRPGPLFCISKCTSHAGDVASLLCYLLHHVARHSMAAVGSMALLIVAIIIVVMIVLGVGTTKSWLWTVLSR
jgi:hypothetical protein